MEFWQQKYMELKRFVGRLCNNFCLYINTTDESLYHITLSQQLMPFMAQPTLQTPTAEGKVKTDLPQPGLVSDPMIGVGGMLQPGTLPSFDFYSQSINNEGMSHACLM